MRAVVDTRIICLCYLYFLCFAVDGAILRLGNPLQWKASQPFLQYVRHSGVDQFIRHYKRCQGIESPLFVWGDEIEYGIFHRNLLNNNFDIVLNASKIRENLISYEIECKDLPIGCEWQPEYGSWMVEAVPRSPFGSYLSDLLNVEGSMQLRRKRLHSFLQKNEIAPTISTFPMLGVEGYEHNKNLLGEIANSVYIDDDVINPHPRFTALTRNIRMRRGRNVDIAIPLDSSRKGESIKMDAMAFGMGCCCLQVTMQLRNEMESRYLHDQLLVLAPIFQALSASTPFFRGSVAATDTRWDVISQAVDDRTIEELGIVREESNDQFVDGNMEIDMKNYTIDGPNSIINTTNISKCTIFNETNVLPISRSRYSSSCLYLSCPETPEELTALQKLHDISVEIDKDVFEKLIKHNVDEVLARHIAHLFIRDPLVIFNDSIILHNDSHLDHFENIQSTNWRSIRWKPPSLEVGQVYQNLSVSNCSEFAVSKILNNSDNDFILRVSAQKSAYADRFGEKIELRNTSLSNPGSLYADRFGEMIELPDNDPAFDNDALIISEIKRNILVCDRSAMNYFVSTNETNDHKNTITEALQKFRNFFIDACKASDHKKGKRDSYFNFDNHNNYKSDMNNTTISVFETLQRVGPGWRVEFRPLEIQLTDFENAAYAIFVVLISRMLIQRNLNLYLPISLVEENMKRAGKKDAVTSQRFYFRRDCVSASLRKNITEMDITQLTMDEIINGEIPSKFAMPLNLTNDCTGIVDVAHTRELFPGLLPLAKEYLLSMGCSNTTELFAAIIPYLTLISERATGEIPTVAKYMREFVLSANERVSNVTAAYNERNHLTPEIADLLLQHCEDIGMGRIPPLHLKNGTAFSRSIQNLDLVDEEDLMFTNMTYFVKRISSPSPTDSCDLKLGEIDNDKNKFNSFVGSVRTWWHEGPWRILRRSKDEKLRF